MDKKKEEINFVWGKPAPSLLPVKRLSLAVQTVLSSTEAATDALEYGDPAGPVQLRQEVVSLLARFYRTPNEVDEVCITAGASQGLVTVLQVLADPRYTRRVWMVAPCFYLACRIFEDAGFRGRLRAVPETDDGIDLAYLEQSMKEVDAEAVEEVERDGRRYRHLIYLVPTFSNPSGRSVPLAHRHRLVELARRFDALVVSDDIYDFIDSSEQVGCLPRLVDIDRALPLLPSDAAAHRHTVSNGSFSKLVGPGVRTGWLSASPALTRRLSQAGASIAGGCPSQLGAALVAQFLASGALTTHMADLLPAYARRRRLMVDAVAELLAPLGVTLVEDAEGREGGYFVWLRLPAGLDGAVVAAGCAEEALAILPGAAFAVAGDAGGPSYSAYLRLAYSWADEEALAEGIARLAGVVGRLQAQ
ncbi:aminotransferase [Nannizzia gypsea CBS 118893]|uniref:Aminotransferase n=1 Tax=Arthroderma gypseum (strain ATCC MYA-4604 / CBS 118893) TaxID=535722 RepID=E4V2M4_ARTGP|nr:aminotransferase [Nannizzia gypsea CBS 118893]EFR04289.1 aminotransferase [Nannizzia gypsea CBS 118893]